MRIPAGFLPKFQILFDSDSQMELSQITCHFANGALIVLSALRFVNRSTLLNHSQSPNRSRIHLIDHSRKNLRKEFDIGQSASCVDELMSYRPMHVFVTSQVKHYNNAAHYGLPPQLELNFDDQPTTCG